MSLVKKPNCGRLYCGTWLYFKWDIVLKWAILGPFFVFLIQLTVNRHMFHIRICRWLDSNCGPLIPEATALPSESQRLYILSNFISSCRMLRSPPRAIRKKWYVKNISDIKIDIFCWNATGEAFDTNKEMFLLCCDLYKQITRPFTSVLVS